MDEIDFFEKYDIEDISKKTRIDKKDLKFLRDEDFDKMTKTKGLGFIKIIEREYKVNLSSKRDRLVEYLKEHDRYKNKEFFIAPPKRINFSKYIAVVVLIFAIFGAFTIFYLKKIDIVPVIKDKYSQNPIVKEAKKISGIDINDTNTSVVFENNSTAKESNSTNSTIKNVIFSKNNIKINSDLNETNTTTIKQQISKEQIDANFSNATVKNECIIAPKVKIWVGVIVLDKHKKKSYLQDSNITMALQNNTLIATGHGDFKLYFKDKEYDFSTKSPMRFYFKDGNLTKISRKRFMELNGGKYW